MTLYDDFLVDGVSLSAGLPDDVQDGACLEGPWQWPYQQGTQRGDLPVYQGFDGAGYTNQPYAAFILPVYMTLSAPPCEDGSPTEQSDDSWAWINNAIEQVRLACKPDQQVTLTRRRSMPAGNDSQTTSAKLSNITTTRDGRDTLRLVIEFTMLDPLWYGPDTVHAITGGTGTLAYEGQTRCHRMTIHVGAGLTDPSVLNNTNGHSFQWAGGVVPSGGIDVDVEARTAVRTTGGADVSRYLRWPKAHLMRLDPGNNAIFVSGIGNATFTYNPAYL